MDIKLDRKFKPRPYQESIFANSLNCNTLIVLPTGLGKTLISIMLSIYYFNKYKKKILFLAPTKPLVEQQKKSFEESISNNNLNFQVLTGQFSPEKRKDLYSADFIFSTPQLIENDLINGILNPKDFCFVIFDECHRATGNYAYTFIAEQFNKSNINNIGLSASPGSSIKEIEVIIQNLYIDNIQVRKYEDEDVKEFANEIEIKPIEVDLIPEIKQIVKKFKEVYKSKFLNLQNIGFLKQSSYESLTKRDLLEFQNALRASIGSSPKDERFWKAVSLSAAMMKLSYGIELIESQDLNAGKLYFSSLFDESQDNSKAAKELSIDNNFREAYSLLSDLVSKNILHPKLDKLKELTQNEINKNKNLKIIIFSQYRESVNTIVKQLSSSELLRPILFVGQSKKGEVKMSQKKQKEILEDFRGDKYNILVSTSVGEEGLDIPKVDMVIFYEPIPSAIRTIQRVGRTGRFNKGNVYVLQANDTRDIITRHISSAKEKRMYKVLDILKSRFSSKPKKDLINFIEHSSKNQEDSLQQDDRVSVYVDSRENSDLIKHLYKLPIKINTRKLDVGDIVISDSIAIERKSKIDFINSILDKRLFSQLIDLSKNYRRPVLIVEGSENIFSLRNINPDVIRSSISSIAVDLRIPIIYTDSIEETSNMIYNIAKRTIKAKKDISISSERKSSNENEELENFISSIPGVNIVTAKSLFKNFSSIKELVNASEKDLLECEGLGKVRAKKLISFFEREYKDL